MNSESRLGRFLKDRRDKLDPSALGYSGRRRTPGLRREEVAGRANISTTWYTWLEQGRGGAPSPRILESLASALMLTEPEREHLFLLGIGQAPKARSASIAAVTPRLQRFLDALEYMPAIVATPHWDVIAWNTAARVALTDYPELGSDERNVLRRMFLDRATRAAQDDWESVARYLVATFRAETARLGEDARSKELIMELSATSSEFVAMWDDNDVQTMGQGIKKMRYAEVGLIAFEYSSFAVDGRPDLKLVTYNAASSEDAEKLHRLCKHS